jgi:hypothetical protein
VVGLVAAIIRHLGQGVRAHALPAAGEDDTEALVGAGGGR